MYTANKIDRQIPASRNAHKCGSVTEWIPVIVLALCAVGLFIAPAHNDLPISATPDFDKDLLSTAALRTPLGDPPISKINGFMRDCQDCHSIFKSSQDHNDGKEQHDDIHLQHGMNNDCFNCHLKSDRNKLRLHGNKSVTFDQSQMLCAQCHGTTYRDWRSGSHGRVQGSWLEYSEERTRLTCVECHDPHKPAFAKIAPLPGPNTLRMGEQRAEQHHHYRSSLMQWLNDNDDDDEKSSSDTTPKQENHNTKSKGHK